MGGVRLPPTHFFKGCTISPFKKVRVKEVMPQYYKLLKKVKQGADFLITQVGFDARKFHELFRYMRYHTIRIPILGNVYILNQAVAKIMNQGRVPGCVVTDELYCIIEEEAKAPDKGKTARLTRAAKLITILKGMGFNGVHIGGPSLSYEDVEWVIEKGKELSLNWEQWVVMNSPFLKKNGFYLFEKDQKTGLNTDVFVHKGGKPHGALATESCVSFTTRHSTPEAPLFLQVGPMVL